VADRFDTWESYFYPETIDPLTGNGTLRNLYDERDARLLARNEYVETSGRAQQIESGAVAIAKTYDGAHLRAIHRHLFQDVYAWAGEYRTVNIAKGPGRGFGDVKTGEVDRYLSDVHQLVSSTDWRRLDRGEFVASAATVFAYVNQAHPFREGNGRTSKLFMQQVAEQSRFAFDYARVTPEVWNQGSALSAPDLYSYAPDPRSLVPVFDAITVDRRQGQTGGLDDPTRGRSALRASYPQAATDATRSTPPAGGIQGRGSAPYTPGARYGNDLGEGR